MARILSISVLSCGASSLDFDRMEGVTSAARSAKPACQADTLCQSFNGTSSAFAALDGKYVTHNRGAIAKNWGLYCSSSLIHGKSRSSHVKVLWSVLGSKPAWLKMVPRASQPAGKDSTNRESK